jgi:antitoxin component YwqK of YwqJK toxin-antitoxin module
MTPAMHAFLLALVLLAAPRRVTDDQGCNKGLDENNELDGEIVCTFPNGKKRHEGLYAHGKRVGVAKTWREDGMLANVDTYKDGLRHGRCQEYDRDGALEEDCEYKADKRDGPCKLYGKGGVIRDELRYIAGQQRGPFSSYWMNGNLREKGTLDDAGKRHGVLERFHEDGSKESATPYVHGERDGVERVWSAEGKLRRELTWKAGRQHGLAKTFHDDGPLAETLCYQNGSLTVGTNACTGKKGPEVVTRYGTRGKPDETYTVRDGKKNGERKVFDKNGAVQLLESYVDGELEGTQKTFDGKLLLGATAWKKGKKDGAEVRYFPDGKVAEESSWKDGELLSHTVWWMNGKMRSARQKEGDLWKRQTWFENGQQETELTVWPVKGQDLRDGADRRWTAAGVLVEERTWVRGKLLMVKQFFEKTGKPYVEEEHKDGVRLSRKEWDEAGTMVKAERYNEDGSRQ